ncbi:hypothetical protein Hanom_Chr05g00405241 [Helianthus anomalus]
MVYGAGLGRRLIANVQVTTLMFQRSPFGVGLSPGVGRGYPHDMATPATPYDTSLKLTFSLGCSIIHVSHHAPNPRSIIPSRSYVSQLNKL